MAEIRFISTSTVQPASRHGGSAERIELTPWDLQLLLAGHNQKGLLFLKPTTLQQHKLLANTLVDHLKISLSRTLEFFPPLAGRLGIVRNNDTTTTSSFFLDCNNAGAQFIHAVVDNVTVGYILDPIYVPRIVHSFFPLNGVCNYQGISNPLLAIQVTELVDGFFIGCTMNHVVADGSSFWNFFNSWSEISRGFDGISRPPVLERWFPSDINCPVRTPLCSEQLNQNKFVLPPLEERVFHFTKEKIAGLKAKANAEMSTTSISSLQALLAHLWRSVVRCQRLDTDQEVKYKLLISARTRLQPPLPEGYFGNTFHVGAVTTKAGELLQRGLGWAAWEMKKAIALHTNDEIRNKLKCWVKDPKLPRMGAITSDGLATGSSPRFNVYGTDFGWGKPVAVRCGPGNKGDGKVTLFPGAEEGSIDIEVCLSPEKLLALGDDEQFMEAVTI